MIPQRRVPGYKGAQKKIISPPPEKQDDVDMFCDTSDGIRCFFRKSGKTIAEVEYTENRRRIKVHDKEAFMKVKDEIKEMGLDDLGE